MFGLICFVVICFEAIPFLYAPFVSKELDGRKKIKVSFHIEYTLSLEDVKLDGLESCTNL